MARQAFEIILSPDLAISPAEFVAAWNEIAPEHAASEATLVTARGALFDPSLIATILISIGTGAASNIIAQVIMNICEKRGEPSPKHTHIHLVKKPDGTETYVVDIDEG
jgi:hypothetical protein